jgi:hypothetical protein
MNSVKTAMAAVLAAVLGVSAQAGSGKAKTVTGDELKARLQLVDDGAARRIAALEEETKAKIEFIKAGAERKQALMALRDQEKVKRLQFRVALTQKRAAAKQAWIEHSSKLRQAVVAQDDEQGEE